MRLGYLYIGILLSIVSSSAWADEMSTLGRLSDIVESQCRRFYDIDTRKTIADLQQKRMSEVDKLACAYPFAFHKVQARLKILEQLDPSSQWDREAYVTLAARIYKFNYLVDTPRDGGAKTEISAVHPDLLILHRILRQTTPYALAFAYPRLGKHDADLIGAARAAVAGASELTPWSSSLRLAKGTDCYGPEKDKCMSDRMQALQNLLQAAQLLAKNEVFYKYVTEYSKTAEATELQSVPLIQIVSGLRKSISGDPVEYILGVRTSADWLRIRPDLRDTLDYLAASDSDLESSVGRIINLETLNCKVVYASLFALANEDRSSSVRQALSALNPMEAVVAADPKLRDDGLKMQSLFDKQDCTQLRPLNAELKMHGLLSRFQAYQTHIILLSSHDDALSHEALRANSRRYALISDVQSVIREVQAKAQESGLELKSSSSPIPQQLVDYISKILKEDNP